MNKNINIIGIFVGFVSISLFLNSCASTSSSRSSVTGEAVAIEKPLNVASGLRFEDIPVPSGFGLLSDQSFVFQDASVRVGLMRYSGYASTSQVVSFFKSQMTLYNWGLQNTVEYGSITMNLTKGDETCVITIQPLATKVLISIVLAPKKGTMTTGLGFSPTKRDKF